MASTFKLSLVFFLSILFSLWIIEARELTSIKEVEENNNQLLKIDEWEVDNPATHMFFKFNDLKLGNKVNIQFSKENLENLPPLLTRQEADLIPFKKSKLDFLLNNVFSFSKDSLQGKAIKETIGHCESTTIKSEIKFCATSLESLIDLVKETLGFNVDFKIMTTKLETVYGNDVVSYGLHNYTFVESIEELDGRKMLACHRMPYPYVVYYCHAHKHGGRIFKVNLMSEDGKQRMVGPAACHMDTSMWNIDHIGFKVLKMEPRSGPVCHFFALENIVWIAK